MTTSNTTSNLFAAVAQVEVITKENVRTPMTKQTVEKLKAKLKKEMCINVYPNQFDIKKPYFVSTRYKDENFSHGVFVNLEVAKMVGNIASLSLYGRKALASKIDDMAAVQSDPEMIEWLSDERNADVISAAEEVYS